MSDFLSMSDEDFEKQAIPEVEAPSTDGAGAAEEVVPDNQQPEAQTAETPEGETVQPEAENGAPAPEAPADAGASADANTDGAAPEKEAATPEGEQKPSAVSQPEAVPVDYEAFFKQVMTPFKANGRTIELKTPEEAIQLMQMGANYTKKMQELVPHRKVLTMLQNNGLMDEDKLSFLIDIEKKNPEAIKKLIADAGIDPMEIDTSTEPAYQEGNHRVSDDEVAFYTTLEDMKSTPERVETLRTIHDDWDQASKEALWNNPGIMTTIHAQRENGIYGRVAAEVERQRTLGAIPANIPFLQAYQVIGDQMTAAGAFADIAAKSPNPAASLPGSNGQVVTTRVAAPKPAVANGDRAAAAAPSRQTTPKAKAPVANPLAMSDDDFLKQFEGRL